ncbi:MAG: histidine kinase [Bacteroidota bacterium]
MNRRQFTYWMAQLIGWGGYTLLLVLSSLSFGDQGIHTFKVLALQVIIGLCSFLGSHLMRGYIKRQGWASAALKRVIPRMLLLNLLTAIGAITLIHILMLTVLNWQEVRPIVWSEIPLYTFNVFMMYCIWAIFYFNFHYFEQTQQANLEKVQAESALREAELIALKAQINPHFLFNSLNNIRGMILENPMKARDMVSNLADLLRYSIGFSALEKVSLQAEIDIVKDYLDLEMVQYENRLDYTLELDPQTLEKRIPPMIIQLLVENAVKHGISQLPEGGQITVKAALQGEDLRIQVQNSGSLGKATTSGIGIQNALDRIRILYAMEPYFDLLEIDGSVLATLKLPATI